MRARFDPDTYVFGQCRDTVDAVRGRIAVYMGIGVDAPRSRADQAVWAAVAGKRCRKRLIARQRLGGGNLREIDRRGIHLRYSRLDPIRIGAVAPRDAAGNRERTAVLNQERTGRDVTKRDALPGRHRLGDVERAAPESVAARSDIAHGECHVVAL